MNLIQQFTWKRCAWLALCAAFVGAAFALRAWMLRHDAQEIWGWDYATFVGQINDWRWIGYFGFRHPGLGLVASPLVVLQHVWSLAYLFVMPAVATATAWLIWRKAGWLALGIWLAFPTTWLLAGTPESFPLAQLALVATVCFAQNWRGETDTSRRLSFCGKRTDVSDTTVRLVGILLFSALNGAITLTNGIKPIAAYVATCGNWRKVVKLVGAGLVAVALGVGFFALRACITGRGIGAGLEATLSWIPENRNLLQELYGFFIRPVGVWQSLVVYPLVIWSSARQFCRRDFALLRKLGSMFAVDAAIHLVIGWGMFEPWVFAPHWIWMIPMIVGQGVKGGSQ